MLTPSARSSPVSGRLLVVDDDASSRLLAARVLQGHGHSVTEAADGETALALVEAALPDVILLDAMMPGPDGFEVCRRLKANPRTASIPVILLTALTHQFDRLAGLEAGADQFMVKPIVTQDLVFAVRNAVLTRRRYLELEARLAEAAGAASRLEDAIRSLLQEPGSPLAVLEASLGRHSPEPVDLEGDEAEAALRALRASLAALLEENPS